IFAVNSQCWDSMYELFKERALKKTYHALCLGKFNGTERVVSEPIEGKEARSHVQILKQGHDLCLLEVEIETGRTHQIRKHMLSIGHPVLGDKEYVSQRSLQEKY